MRFIGVFNRDGGTFKTTDMEAFAARVVEIFTAQGHEIDVRIVEGKNLIPELTCAAGEAEILLAGGGDGTISAAAAAAFRQGIPLAVVPAGTMNLFARSLQIPLNLDAALEALATGETKSIDIATANGRPFVHQFSVGVHAKLVKLRETLTYKSRIGKMMASARASASAILNAPSFFVDVTTRKGVDRRATSGISVSNNALDEGHLPRADELDRGVLGIYVIPPLTPWVLTKLCFGVLRGKFKSLPEIIDREAREVTIRFPRKKSGSVAVIDGELTKLADRVDLKIHPGALQVIVPRPPAEIAAPSADDLLAPA
jgi:diacylglycerol kinase family enzyme